MGCEGCYSGPAYREQQYSQVKQNAKAYAIQQKEGVFIYQDPVEGFKFILESKAAGYPVGEYISHFENTDGSAHESNL